MCDDWMPTLQLPLPWEQYLQLPRNAGYRYEYLQGMAHLTPRPRHYHALLNLHAYCSAAAADEKPGEAVFRHMREDDFRPLETVFQAAFHRIQPFGSLDDAMRREAAHQSLQRTQTGGDGPWIQDASFVALRQQDERCGAILITLLPPGDPADWESYYWSTAPPADCIARRQGRPHLTWIFVDPANAGHSVGTALLTAAARSLLAMGYRELATTFMLGNESSMLWHWRNGFQLLTHPSSPRRVRQRVRQEEHESD